MQFFLVRFDNTGTVTVQASTALEAMKQAELKAQEHGWNLRAVSAVALNNHSN